MFKSYHIHCQYQCRRALHEKSSISVLLEHFFIDVSVAQLVASMSGVVLGGVVELRFESR